MSGEGDEWIDPASGHRRRFESGPTLTVEEHAEVCALISRELVLITAASYARAWLPEDTRRMRVLTTALEKLR